MGMTLLSQPAQAVLLTVNSTQYDVTTFSGTYNANSSKFATAANGGLMPWFGNQTLANQFALAVYNLTPTNGGLADNLDLGPLFAHSVRVDTEGTGISNSSVSMNPSSGDPVGQLSPTGTSDDFSGNYATATPTAVPWETDALSVIGTTLLFAGGVWTKRKSVKPLDKE